MKSASLRCLIVGTGSIGRRHIRSLQALVDSPQYVFLRQDGREDDLSRDLGARVVARYEDALDLQPELAVIASPTVAHIDALEWLLPSGIPCYIEKPVVATFAQCRRLHELLGSLDVVPPTIVGCNLRFLGSLRRVRELVADGGLGRVVRASFQVGQWLPDWRPAQDYRRSYSAHAEHGGGVVLDLIHELDAVRWMLGEFDRIHAVGGKYSCLEIDSEDAASIILGRDAGPAVAVGLDYVSRRVMRRYDIVGDEASIHWDLPGRSLLLSDKAGTRSLSAQADDYDVASTYLAAMTELLTAIGNRGTTSQHIGEGLKTSELALRINEKLRTA